MEPEKNIGEGGFATKRCERGLPVSVKKKYVKGASRHFPFHPHHDLKC